MSLGFLRRALLLLLCAALPGSADAQRPGSLVVHVTVAGSSQPVAEASVVVEGTSRGGLTDRNGRMAFQGLPPGSHALVIERIGFATERREVDVPAAGDLVVEVTLSQRAISMPEVVVSATREARRLDEVAASVGVIGRRALTDAHASHPSEIMSKVAGVWVNVTGGEGHMTAIRQPLTTDPVYLYLEDGVPTRSTGFFNHNALYEINLPQAERIEVMKGPANALYGSDAIGGVINVQTRTPSEDVELQLTTEGGGHGFARVLASASSGTPIGDVRADLNYTRTDGWRAGTGYDRWSGTVRLDRRWANGLSVKAVAAYSNVDQNTAGSSVLSRTDFEANPRRNYTPISWREVTALRLSAEVERLMGRTSVVVTPYVRSNTMDLLPNWSLTFDPGVWETENHSVGVLAKVRRALPQGRGEVIAGVDVDVSPGSHVERVIEPVRDGPVFTGYTEGATIYDYDVTFRQASPYLHAEVRATDRLRVTGGLRVDLIDYAYENRLSPLETGRHRRPADASPSYAALSPKLGVTLQLSGVTSLFGAYRRGFRVPSEGQLFRQGPAENTLGLEPVESDAFEVGVRGLIGSRVRFDLAAYHMRMLDEILGYQLADGSTENVNAGETLHRGVEAGVGVALGQGLQLDLAYTLASHRYERWSPRPAVELSGREQESAPNRLGHTELSWTPGGTRDAQLALTWDHLGPYWMDQTNQHRYEGHDVFGARASLALSQHLSAYARVTNLTDARYAERATYNAFRGEELAPGLPRTFYVGVEVR